METGKTSSPGTTLLALCVSGFLMPFMLSGVGVALPSIGRDYNANAVELGLVETGYMASVSLFMLTMGRLADIYGRRRLFLLGIALFSLVGGMIAFAWSMKAVIVLRFFQGIGGAMIASTIPAILVAVYPPGERGRVLGLLVAAVYLGLSVGPLLGGAIISVFGWRALFYMVTPLGLTLFFVTAKTLRGEWAEAAGEPFDYPGALVYGVAILMATWGAANLAHGGWAWWLLFGGLSGLVLFIVVEANTRYPILDVRLLRDNRIFALSNLATLLNYAATFGVTFFLSLYLQYIKGMSPHGAGLVLIAQPVTQAALSPLFGKLADRAPADRLATLGMAICALGLGFLSLTGETTPIPVFVATLAAMGVGFALFSSPNAKVIMSSVEPRHLGVASGLSSSMRSLGMMASMTMITVILSVIMGGEQVTEKTRGAFLSSMHWGFLTFSLLCVVGTFISYNRIKPPSPAVAQPAADSAE